MYNIRKDLYLLKKKSLTLDTIIENHCYLAKVSLKISGFEYFCLESWK